MEPALGGEPSDTDEARKGELAAASESIEPALRTKSPFLSKPARELEAGAGIEPANRGFADPDLTTWLPRQLSGEEVSSLTKWCQCASPGSIYRFSDLMI